MSKIDNAILVYKVLDQSEKINKLSLKVLFFSYLVEEKILMHQMAEEMKVTVSAVSLCVRKLEKNGYLKRKQDEGDHRQVQVIITAKGTALVERLSQTA